MAASEKFRNGTNNVVLPISGQKVTAASTSVGKKRGRKPLTVDAKKRVEQSRQSARECRARKKLRYQYVEELVTSREKAICSLRSELNMLKHWCLSIDHGVIPPDYMPYMTRLKQQLLGSSTSAFDDSTLTDVHTDFITGSSEANLTPVNASNDIADNFVDELPDLGDVDQLLNS